MGSGNMAEKKLSFVTTTINIPEFVEGYFNNAEQHGHGADEVEFIVVGDLKSPEEIREYCKEVSEEYPFEAKYLGPEDQIAYLRQRGLHDLNSLLSFNSLQRRNVGFLYAYENGSDVIVSLDDDNLARDDDIVSLFSSVGEEAELTTVGTPNNWFNCCRMMEYENQSPAVIYPRGFPYTRRDNSAEYRFDTDRKEVAIRAGLWFDVPDIDVITHLERSPRSVALSDDYDEPVALSQGTFCPVNTQNTGFKAEMLPLIYAIQMGDEIKGMEIQRFDDIWLGYFAEKILHSRDEAVAFGKPVSTHDRNTHDLYRELEHEAIGVRLNEVLVDALERVDITQEGYLEAYRELIEKMRDAVREETEDRDFHAFFDKMFDGMEIWADATEQVME